MIYVFADCELDTQLYHLRRAGKCSQLQPKVFQVLTYLLAHRDRFVSKQELCEQVWSARFVSDATLENCIKAVRRIVGDSGRSQRIIQTRHSYGYRFIADVTMSHATLPSASFCTGCGQSLFGMILLAASVTHDTPRCQ